MSLRSLLTYAHEDAGVSTLAEAAVPGAGERAFVSASMRPYLLAAVLDAEPGRPALVIAGDDRAARESGAKGFTRWALPGGAAAVAALGVAGLLTDE